MLWDAYTSGPYTSVTSGSTLYVIDDEERSLVGTWDSGDVVYSNDDDEDLYAVAQMAGWHTSAEWCQVIGENTGVVGVTFDGDGRAFLVTTDDSAHRGKLVGPVTSFRVDGATVEAVTVCNAVVSFWCSNAAELATGLTAAGATVETRKEHRPIDSISYLEAEEED